MSTADVPHCFLNMKKQQIEQYSFLPERLRHKVACAKSIGEGSFGQVYLLSDSSSFQYVLKRVSIRNFDEQQQAASVEEALILSRLDHRNICALYDFFLDGEFL